MNIRDRVIELGVGINALRSELAAFEPKRVQLATMEKELDSLLMQSQQPVKDDTPKREHGLDNNGTGTMDQRILRVLASSPAVTFNALKIHAQMSDVNIDSLRSALARMANEGTIDRPERGIYRGK